MDVATKSGAPIESLLDIQPMVAEQSTVGLLKKIRHPNAAKLFVVFLFTDEAQRMLQESRGTSMYVRGTPAWKRTQGKQVIALDDKYAEKIDALVEKYGKMIGYR